jgi:hypothetical protein
MRRALAELIVPEKVADGHRLVAVRANASPQKGQAVVAASSRTTVMGPKRFLGNMSWSLLFVVRASSRGLDRTGMSHSLRASSY